MNLFDRKLLRFGFQQTGGIKALRRGGAFSLVRSWSRGSGAFDERKRKRGYFSLRFT